MTEPKNRIKDPLPFLEIRIDHVGGSIKSCPNGIAASAIWGMSGEKPDLPEKFLAAGSQLFNPLELKPIEGAKSIISGQPAVIYRADDYEIPLTPDELFRFVKHDLEPKEFFKIRDHFGDLHEIHDDFYDPDTGEAFQPMGR